MAITLRRFIISTLMAGCLSFTLNLQACELYWYLAASMAKPGRDVVEDYNREAPECRVLLVVGGSGQILSQLELAGKGDIYTPASESFLKKATAKNLVTSHRLLLEQKPVFGVSARGAAKLKTFEDLSKQGISIALGNPKTMALGKTYLRIEEGMSEKMKNGIRTNTRLLAININQVVNYLRTGTVDAGITFNTTATANKLSFISIPDDINVVNRAYLAVLKFTEHQDQVREFMDYVFDQGVIFKQYGFELSR